MFGQVISSGSFPSRWGKSIVCPIYKGKGDKADRTNYRPIAIISVLSKLFEKILVPQLVDHLEVNHLLSDNQYGFRKNRSTQFATLHVAELVRGLLNTPNATKPIVSALLLDLSKAFDCVNHRLLLNELEHVGLQPLSLDLIRTYLSRRSQKVKISVRKSDTSTTVYSEEQKTTCGVPQGSVLGPILFNIYVNSLSAVICEPKTTLISYADDTTIISWGTTLEEIVKKTEANIIRVHEHLVSLGLTMNVQKTQYMLFGKTYSNSPNTWINVPASQGLHVLKPEKKVKLLGITVTHDLKFNEYQKETLGKMRSGLFVIKSVRKKISFNASVNLVNALIYSHHDYCSLVWNEHGSALYNEQMENTHKMVWRQVYQKPYDYPSAEIYRLSGVLPLHLRRTLKLLRFAHATTYEMVPVNWQNFLNVIPDQTNYSHRAHVDHTHALIFHKGLRQQASRLWNSLPRWLRSCPSANEFKVLCLNYMHTVQNSAWVATGSLVFPNSMRMSNQNQHRL
jgi:hypothetical protein